ncbi:MAG: SRPBCC family protein [Armatimonadota bacterium]|nr:SRPBCC family protein [Armatimonadota bacterium]
MPRIEASVTANADVDRVFALARDIERYPEFMPDLKSVRILEREGDRLVSEWTGLISDFKVQVKWTEEDVWDTAARTCRFRQLKGDFQQYEGIWTFAPAAEGTEMRLELDYRYEVPLIGPLLKALVARLMKANVEAMLNALKARAEAKA